jgi:hypothetical protein
VKKYFIYILLFFLPTLAWGQVEQMGQMEKQSNEGEQFVVDSIQSLFPVSKLSLLKDVNFIFNTRFAYGSSFLDGNHTMSKYNVDQFRFEIKGRIHNKVRFRFRDRYTRAPELGNLDNIKRSIDLAFITIDLSPRTKLAMGKLVADFGGWEFDMNPINILAYNDIVGNSDNFLVGTEISHAFKDQINSLSFQILNSRTNTFEEQYGVTAPPNITASEYPLAFVVNWRGSFFNKKIETTYSYSFFNEAKGVGMNYIAFGNKYKTKNFNLYYDFQYSQEGLDRRKIVSNIINSQHQYAAENAVYLGHWVRAGYLIKHKINLILTLMTTNFYWKDNPDPNGESKLATSYGIIPTIEYLPFKHFNMKFYVGYVARNYNYTSYAETAFGVNDYTTGLLSFGFIAPLLVL